MCRARRGGARTPSKTADENLDCVLVAKSPFPHRSLILKSQQNGIELSDLTWKESEQVEAGHSPPPAATGVDNKRNPNIFQVLGEQDH